MRPKKPTHVLIDQVRIAREGNDVIIDHADANLSGARITGIATMTDAEIVEMYNQILDSQWALLEAWDKTVVEEPPGERQIDYHENSDQWVPCGDVLRCIIDDGGPNGDVIDPYRRSGAVAPRVRPAAPRACGMGHADRVRSRGIRHREPDRQNPQAREGEGEGASEAVTAVVTVGLPPYPRGRPMNDPPRRVPDGPAGENLRNRRRHSRGGRDETGAERRETHDPHHRGRASRIEALHNRYG